MADHNAIAAVSRTLRTLLRDRLNNAAAAVTLAPPDIEPSDVQGARVNLYLFQVTHHPQLANQEIPGHAHPSEYGSPPLSLKLRYLLTSHSQSEDGADSDINAQILLGDAMSVLHDSGGRIEALAITRPSVGTVGQPILDAMLADEFERVKLTFQPAGLEELTKLWAALPEANFRRSVIYDVSVVQIESVLPKRRPQPVTERRVFASVARRPLIRDAYVTPAAPADRPGEHRARVGDEITLEVEGIETAKEVFVRLGRLDPIAIVPPYGSLLRFVIPDDKYPLSHPAPLAIPERNRLQPGALVIQLVATREIEGVAGGMGRGDRILDDRAAASNTAVLQLVPGITQPLSPTSGDAGLLLTIKGTRLWRQGGLTEVLIGDAPIRVTVPGPADPWAAPSPSQIEVPIAEAAAMLPTPPGTGADYSFAVQVDGARSRDVVTFKLMP